MSNSNKILLGACIVLLLCNSTLLGQASTPKSEEIKPKMPIVIEGDEVSFSDLTGDVFAKGNVLITQNNEKMMTDFMQGNTKQSEVWMDGVATFFQPNMKLTGTGTHYNYQKNTGTMLKATGRVKRQFVTGNKMEIFTGELILHDGTLTECPAKVPDYHVSAEKVEIWPGEKMIAYNAKFWIKNTVIFSMAKYQKSLRADEKSEFPSIGFTSHDGLAIVQYLEYPLGDKVAAFAGIGYYNRVGFKPTFGLIDREQKYSMSLNYGNYKDSDSHWIKKEPELRIDYFSQRVGTLPISYTFSGSYGKWSDATKSSWHQNYTLYFTRDILQINETLNLAVGAGVEQIRDSYDSSTQNGFKFDTTLTKTWSPRLSTWLGYHYTKSNDTVFEYERPDMARELDTGFSYKLDNKNTLAFNQRYDIENQRVYDQDYTLTHDLHCWQASVTYRAKRSQVNVTLSTTQW